MAYYPQPPPHAYPYPPAPYAQAPYPSATYGPGYYENHMLNGYPPPLPPHYSGNQVTGGPPSKKRKNNAGSAKHVPPAFPLPVPYPPAAGYGYPPPYPPAYPPYPPPVLGAPPPLPIPPPGWIPPPPPGWTGPPVPSPSPYGTSYAAPYPPPVYPPAEHRHRDSFQSHSREKPDAGFARSKQWHNPNGPYGKGARAVSAAVSTTSHSSPHSGQTPREGSTVPTPPTATPGSVAAVPRSRSRGSLSHARRFSNDLHLDDDDYFFREDEEINPALSLGEIVWKPAVPVKRAMPAGWKQADKYFKELPVPLARDSRDESRSRYATTEENAMEECGPARMRDNWLKMKDDPIFADLTAKGQMITRAQVFANRSRSAVPDDGDVDAEEGEISGAPQYDFSTAADREDGIGSSPPPHYAAFYSHSMPPPPPPQPNPADVPMQGIEDRVAKSLPPAPLPQIDDDLIDSAIRSATASLPVKKDTPVSHKPPLPQLNPESIPDLSLPPRPPRGLKRSRSRSASPERKVPKVSHLSQKLPEWVKDEAQEDILAMLGVSGAPKPVFQTPGPAYTAPPEGYRANSQTPVPGAFIIPPPPPPPPPPPVVKLEVIAEDEDDGNPWGTGINRAGTPNSQHTMVGSDFNGMDEDMEVTPKAKVSMQVKKEEQVTPSKSPDLETTPRPSARKRAPRIHEAFSRRW